MRASPLPPYARDMALLDTAAPAVPLGGPDLPQERRLVTELPGPRSAEVLARKADAVAAGVGHTVPVAAVAAGGGVVVDADGKPTRVRFEERDGKKVRVAVKSGETIDG